jgi:hypothetical protein
MAPKPSSRVSDFLASERGNLVASIIVGFGLATLFQRVCKGHGCVIVRSPPHKDLAKYLYRVDGRCFRYRPEATACAASEQTSASSSRSAA